MIPEMRFLRPITGGRSHHGLTILRIIVACLYLLGTLSIVQIVGSSLLFSMELAGSMRTVWAFVVLVAVWLFIDYEVHTKIALGHLV